MNKREVFPSANRPWSADKVPRGKDLEIPGSDPKEAIEMCLQCERKDCTSSCWAIKEILWRVNGKHGKGGKKHDTK